MPIFPTSAESAAPVTALAPPEPPLPVHSCPSCAHWLPDGTLSCPDCHTLAYGQYLAVMAAEAQQLETAGNAAAARERWQMMLGYLPPDTRQAEGIRQRLAALDGRTAAEADRKARITKRFGPLAPLVLFLLKAKSAIFLLFKFKFLLSFLLYFGLYWALFGWRFALGLTVTILIHEMGHYLELKRRGLQAELPVFLPGFGAYVRWQAMGVTREAVAAISLAGPLFGFFAAAGCWAFWYATHYPLWLVLANITAWYNIVNLFPVFGLDGAKAVPALSRLQRGLVAAACVVYFALTSAPNPLEFANPSNHYIFLVLAALLGFKTFSADAPEEPHTGSLAGFLGITLLLGIVLHMTMLQMLLVPQFALPMAGPR